jgi:hypothetical protein
MSLTFEANKEKKLSMIIEVKNIDNNELEYTFNIEIDKIVYGFPCTLKEDKIEINVPALDTIIKEVKSGTYNAYLDVISENKFHSRPFEEKITIKQEPKVDVLLSSEIDTDIKENLNVLVSKIIDIDENKEKVDKEKTKKENKKETKISKMFE